MILCRYINNNMGRPKIAINFEYVKAIKRVDQARKRNLLRKMWLNNALY